MPGRDQWVAAPRHPSAVDPPHAGLSQQSSIDHESVSAMSPTRITHLIAGAEWDGTAERTSPVYNPATGEQTSVLDFGHAAAGRRGRARAKVAWENEWRHSTLTKRTQILFKFRELLNERKDEIAELITAEHGKVTSGRSR